MAILKRTREVIQKMTGGVSADALDKMLVLAESDKEVLRKTVTQYKVIEKSIAQNSQAIKDFIKSLERSGDFAQAEKVKKMIASFSGERISGFVKAAENREKMQKKDIITLLQTVQNIKEELGDSNLKLDFTLGDLANDFSKYINNNKLADDKRLGVLQQLSAGVNTEIDILLDQKTLTQEEGDDLNRLQEYSKSLMTYAELDGKGFKKNAKEISKVLKSLVDDPYKLKTLETLDEIDSSTKALSIDQSDVATTVESLKGEGEVAGAKEESLIAKKSGQVAGGFVGHALDITGLGFMDEFLGVSDKLGDSVHTGFEKFLGPKGFLPKQMMKLKDAIKSMSSSVINKLSNKPEEIQNANEQVNESLNNIDAIQNVNANEQVNKLSNKPEEIISNKKEINKSKKIEQVTGGFVGQGSTSNDIVNRLPSPELELVNNLDDIEKEINKAKKVEQVPGVIAGAVVNNKIKPLQEVGQKEGNTLEVIGRESTGKQSNLVHQVAPVKEGSLMAEVSPQVPGVIAGAGLDTTESKVSDELGISIYDGFEKFLGSGGFLAKQLVNIRNVIKSMSSGVVSKLFDNSEEITDHLDEIEKDQKKQNKSHFLSGILGSLLRIAGPALLVGGAAYAINKALSNGESENKSDGVPSFKNSEEHAAETQTTHENLVNDLNTAVVQAEKLQTSDANEANAKSQAIAITKMNKTFRGASLEDSIKRFGVSTFWNKYPKEDAARISKLVSDKLLAHYDFLSGYDSEDLTNAWNNFEPTLGDVPYNPNREAEKYAEAYANAFMKYVKKNVKTLSNSPRKKIINKSLTTPNISTPMEEPTFKEPISKDMHFEDSEKAITERNVEDRERVNSLVTGQADLTNKMGNVAASSGSPTPIPMGQGMERITHIDDLGLAWMNTWMAE